MDIEWLARQFRGQVTLWGEIDRQRVLPFGTPREVRAAVDRVRTALDFGRGGLIAQCEWGLGVPFDNVAAVFNQWQRPVDSRQSAVRGEGGRGETVDHG
jgi:uroporphyrinogen decarboxylase